METLLSILNDAIRNNGYTVSALARDCGCSRQHIYQILRGEQHPSLSLAEKLLAAVGAEITIKKAKRQKVSA